MHDLADFDAAIVRNPFLVVSLCAAWCDTCSSFQHGFEALATSRPDATFLWLDIEDDAELVGDIDVENFPTIVVFHRGRPVHFGTSLPQAPIVARLLLSLDAGSATVAASSAATTLFDRVARFASQP